MELLKMKVCVGHCHWLSLLQYFTIHSSVTSFSARDNITSLLATPCHTWELENVSLRALHIRILIGGSAHCQLVIGHQARVTQPLVSIMILYLQMSLTQNFRGWWGSEADKRGLLWGMRTFDTELGQESFSNKEDFIIVLSNYDILLGELSLSGPAPGSSVPEREDFNSKIMGKQAAEEC